CGDRQFRPHQTPLLHHARRHQSYADCSSWTNPGASASAQARTSDVMSNRTTPTRKDTSMKPATKSLNLPKPIAAYFAADKGDGEAVSQCFSHNAVVK